MHSSSTKTAQQTRLTRHGCACRAARLASTGDEACADGEGSGRLKVARPRLRERQKPRMQAHTASGVRGAGRHGQRRCRRRRPTTRPLFSISLLPRKRIMASAAPAQPTANSAAPQQPTTANPQLLPLQEVRRLSLTLIIPCPAHADRAFVTAGRRIRGVPRRGCALPASCFLFPLPLELTHRLTPSPLPPTPPRASTTPVHLTRPQTGTQRTRTRRRSRPRPEVARRRAGPRASRRSTRCGRTTGTTTTWAMTSPCS